MNVIGGRSCDARISIPCRMTSASETRSRLAIARRRAISISSATIVVRFTAQSNVCIMNYDAWSSSRLAACGWHQRPELRR